MLEDGVRIFPQLTVTLIASLSLISNGMHIGWSAPAFTLLRSEDSPIKITKNDETWLETIYLLSGLLGYRYRISLISWLTIGCATKVEYLYLARFLAGLVLTISLTAIQMYCTEIAERSVRGLLTGLASLMILLGMLIVYAVAPFYPYYVPSVVGGSLLALQLAALFFLPESPYFLLSKGKRDLARKSLDKLRTGSDNDREFEEIVEAMEQHNLEKGGLRDLILVDSNRRVCLVVSVLLACEHFSGFSVLSMNLHLILTEAGSVYLDPNSTAIAFAALMLAAAAVCSLLVDKFGRRLLLTTSSILTGICLLTLSVYFNLKAMKFDMRGVSWIPVVSIVGYALTCKLGLGFLPEIIAAELLPIKIKAAGMSLGNGVCVIFTSLSVVFYQYVADGYGICVPFYVFAGVCFLVALFAGFFVPETKGKSLEEIQSMVEGPKINET